MFEFYTMLSCVQNKDKQNEYKLLLLPCERFVYILGNVKTLTEEQ